MLNESTMRFARQCGATHAVIHLVDYTGGRPARSDSQPVGNARGWGWAGLTTELWGYDSLCRIRDELQQHGLVFEAIENFDPTFWYDVLLDGPERSAQIERLAGIIRTLGQVGIRVMGYNFSLGGVAGRTTGAFARGEAESVGVTEIDNRPIPRGMVWNMLYAEPDSAVTLPEISEDELWDRYRRFLEDLIPVAEEAGVALAAHPDDPPVERMRRQPRLIRKPEQFEHALRLVESPANKLELCLGTLREMPGSDDTDFYAVIERHARNNEIGYIHLRNVVGRAPNYHEVFIDEGDLDVARVLRILEDAGYEGVVIPDHTPQMSCDAPWHAGMAYAIGYIRGLLAGFRS